MSHPPSLARGVLLVLALVAPLAAQADLVCAARARYIDLISNATTADTGLVIGAGGCSQGLFGGGVGVAVGTADAALGVLKVDAHADTINQPDDQQTLTRAEAQASWSDRFTIHAPGMGNNQFGFFDFSVTLTGWLDSHAASVVYRESQSNLARWRFTLGGGSPGFGIPNGTFAAMSGNGSSLARVDGEDNLRSWNLTLTGQIRFRFATDQGLSATLEAEVMTLQEESSIDLFFGNSVYWGGITAVRDANGKLLSLAAPGQAAGPGQYTMSTLSGIDWHPSMVPPAVPEPGSALLLLLGLPWLLARRRQP